MIFPQKKLGKISPISPHRKGGWGMEEMKMGTYVLADKEGRILTNKEGYPRIWFSQNQAKRDAKSIFVGVPLLVQTGLGEQIKNKDWRIEMK